jgi:crotonobetainyl-CoA:carnitine CoA-transferase CaiB-like acyl-CoA transferase
MYNHSFEDEPPPEFPEYGSLSRLWKAADGQVAIGMMQDIEFVALARAVGLPDLAEDERLRSMGGRMKHQKEWAPRVTAAIAAMSVDELMAGFIREGAVGGRVNTAATVADDPQVRHNGTVVSIDHGGDGRVRVARPPARFAATPAEPGGPAPRLGEHGDAVLTELGFDAEARVQMIADGAIKLR